MNVRIVSIGHIALSNPKDEKVLFESIKHRLTYPRLPDYNETKVMLSDQRQSFTEDKWHPEGPFLNRMDALSKHIQGDTEFLPFLLADALNDLDLGVSYARIIQAYNGAYTGEHGDGQIDASQCLVLYAQMQCVASLYPQDTAIEFEFYGANATLVKNLKKFFRANSLFIPHNIALYILNMDETQKSFTANDKRPQYYRWGADIQGTGPLDDSYYHSVQCMQTIIENTKALQPEQAEQIEAIDVINYENLSVLAPQFKVYPHIQNTIGITWEESPHGGRELFDVTKLAKKDEVKREDLLNPDLDFIVTTGKSGRQPVRLKAGKIFMSYCPGGKDSFTMQLFSYDAQGNLKQLLNSSQNRYGWTKFEDLIPVSLDAFYPERTTVGHRPPQQGSPSYEGYMRTQELTQQIKPLIHQLMLGHDIDNQALSSLIVEYATVDKTSRQLKSDPHAAQLGKLNAEMFDTSNHAPALHMEYNVPGKPKPDIILPIEDFRDVDFFGVNLDVAPVNLSEVSAKIAIIYHLSLGISNQEIVAVFKDYCGSADKDLTAEDIRVIREIKIDQARYSLKSILGDGQDEKALNGFPEGYGYKQGPIPDALDQALELIQAEHQHGLNP